MDHKIVSTRNFLLNLTVALLVPSLAYYLSLIFTPNYNMYISQEYIEINKISKKISKLKNKKNKLEDLEIALFKSAAYSKINEIKNDIKTTKEEIKNLKILRSEKERVFNKKYSDINNRTNKIIFYVTNLLGILGILFGVVTKTKSIKPGLIIGGLLSISLGNISYWQNLSQISKLVQILVMLAFIIFIIYKLYPEEADKIKNKRS